MYPRCTSNPQFPLVANVPWCPLKSIYPLFWWWHPYIYKLIASTNNAVINMLIQASSFTSARIFLRMSVPRNAELWYLLFWLNSSRLLSKIAVPVYIFTSSIWGFLTIQIFINTWHYPTSMLLHFSSERRHLIVPLTCIYLITK